MMLGYDAIWRVSLYKALKFETGNSAVESTMKVKLEIEKGGTFLFKAPMTLRMRQVSGRLARMSGASCGPKG
jgi:hypothetical protein